MSFPESILKEAKIFHVVAGTVTEQETSSNEGLNSR